MTSSIPTSLASLAYDDQYGYEYDDPYGYDGDFPMAIYLPPTDSPTISWYTANEYETDVSEPNHNNFLLELDTITFENPLKLAARY